MTLLIDPPNAPGHGRLWSHLASDESYDELHRFAASLGIPRRGFDRDHYDIPSDRYAQVVAAGATPVSSRDLVRRLHAAGLRRRKSERLGPRSPGQGLVRPRRLEPGDVVAVVAPAGPVPAERLEAGLTVLRSWGLTVVESPHVRARHAGLDYLTADDGARAADLTGAWNDPAVRGVLCARGGYGVQRMVDLLDYDALADAGPKVLAGFSDITGLHQAFARRLGLATVHGPVVTSLGDADEDTREHLRRLLLEPEQATTVTPRPCPSWGSGRAEGILVGGNLALLASDVGTPSSMPAARSLAVLEDVGESPYRLDRTLTHLLRSGWFDGVRGIVLGEFVRCGDPAAVRGVLEDRLAPLGVPVLLDVPIGHVAHNRAFALGVPAVLDAGAGTLDLLEPGLR